MSINPVLAQDTTSKNELFPLPAPGEVFILKRDGMALSVTNSAKKYNGKGKAFLTSKRIVFLRDGKPEHHKEFTSIELPLALLTGNRQDEPPKFQQPIFGANYLEGNLEPASRATIPLQATSRWTLTFNKGGCQTFLKAFYNLYKKARANPNAQGVDPVFAQQLHMGSQAAFFDPSDPSVLYVTQPVPQGQSSGGATWNTGSRPMQETPVQQQNWHPSSPPTGWNQPPPQAAWPNQQQGPQPSWHQPPPPMGVTASGSGGQSAYPHASLQPPLPYVPPSAAPGAGYPYQPSGYGPPPPHPMQPYPQPQQSYPQPQQSYPQPQQPYQPPPPSSGWAPQQPQYPPYQPPA